MTTEPTNLIKLVGTQTKDQTPPTSSNNFSNSTEIQQIWTKVIESINYHNPLMPKNWHLKNFDNFVAPAGSEFETIVKKLSDFDLTAPYGVFLTGVAGVGKTHLLLSLLGRLAWLLNFYENGTNGEIKFYNYSDLCGILRQDPNDFKLLCKIRSPRFLFIDDLGTSKTSDFVQEKIYSIFNHRVENGLATFVTTNLTHKEIGQEFTERMTSRIKESSVWIEIKSKTDYRSNHFIKNMKEFNKG